MNCGEVASNRSTAALANGVSGMRTPASDSRRVIVTITELLIACLMPSPLSVNDWNESDSDTPAAATPKSRQKTRRSVSGSLNSQQTAHSLARQTVAALPAVRCCMLRERASGQDSASQHRQLSTVL